MDSRFNFGDAYSVPRGEEFRSVGSWVPATPQKHVPASPLWPPAHVHENQPGRMRWPEMGRLPAGYAQDMPNYSAAHIHENQLDRMSWPEMGRLPARYTQDMPNYTAEAHHLGLGQIHQVGAPCGYYVGNAGLTEKSRLINHIAGSYTHAVFNGSDSRKSNSLATLLGLKNSVPTSSTTRHLDTSIRHSSLILNSLPQVSNSRESNLGEVPLANRSSCSSSDLLSRHNNLSQSPQYGFPVPYHPNYDQADAGSSLTTRHQYKPVAPEQVMMLKHEQLLPMVNLSQEARSSKEKEKQPDSFISLENEAGFPVPYHPNYDQADAGSSLTTKHQYKPVAPEQVMKLKHEQLLPMVNLSQEASSSKEKEKQLDSFISLENEANQQNSNELLHSILDLSSAVLSTLVEEPKDSDRLSDQGIDLNKTPQQKPPKRKKHRPKVIVEGKPQKNKKAAPANVTNLKETPAGKRKYVRKQGLSEPNSEKEVKPTGKRKYVRKKGLEESATQHVESNGWTSYPAPTAAAKSCRRALNFDLENSGPGRAGNSFAQPVEILNGKKMASNLRMGSQAVEPSNGAKMIIRTNSTLEISQKIGLPVDEQKLEATTILAHSMTEMTTDYPSIPERRVAAAQLAATNGKQMASLHISMDTRIQNEGIHQLVFPTANSESLEKTRELMFQRTPQSVPKCSSYLTEGRRSKRDYQHIEQTSHHGSNQTSPEIFLWGNSPQRSIMSGADSSDPHKKRKTDSVSQTNPYSMASWFGATNGSRQMTKHMDDFNSFGSTSQRHHEIIDSYCENVNISRRESGRVNRSTTDWGIHSMASRHSAKQYIVSEPHQCTERMKETNRLAQVHNFCSSTANQKDNMAPATPCLKGPAPGDQQQLKTCNIDNLKKQQTLEPTLSTCAPSLTSKMPEAQKVLNNRQKSSAKRRGRPAKQEPPSVEEITNQIEGLNLLERSSRIKGKDQYAIVPYKGDGAVVPYEMKRHKPRPKVDLDAETERVWRLLMGKDSCENLEAKDKEKEKWWEEERRVFHGRADSFIARMHLVQGDRRFSKWKGSVVDSVVGVFLTQNVSDHLSSSAFMSLAARFPIKLFGHPLCSQNSVTTKESLEHQRYCRTSWIDKTTMLPAQSLSPEEEVLSSQDSIDSSVIQADGGVRSYTGSNSETEDPGMGCKPHKNHDSFSTDLQFENTTSFEEFYTRISGTSLFLTGSRHVHEQPEDRQSGQLKSGLEKLDNLKGSSTLSMDMNHRTPWMQIPVVPSSNDQLLTRAQPMLLEGFESHPEESTSYWPSTAPRFKEKDAIYIGKTVGQNAANSSTVKTTTQRYAVSSYQGTPVVGPNSLLSKKSMPEKSNSQLCHDIQLHQTNESFQLKGTSSVILTEAQAKGQKSYQQHISNIPELSEKGFDDKERVNLVDKQKQSKNQLAEPNSTKLVHPTNTARINARTKTARKGKAEGENKDAVDWDSLRKEVLEKAGRKERSEDTVDSLDYIALRCASIQEISEAIKERGMNNMLAERIKEFLDRLVTEHGSIDLEWLRDLSPEKAKDYLLSIRGLGLKSVECVRLLTLHHVAFPVDTNVGRIAVRLGWVPLQPLPESLQIHLLELYPVLESIQKYLWPRLCTLDQQTLYELHYQLITFGKVFCTKKSPNCNACPMRAECRHFASAFASARLALPAPEEKSKVTSTVSNIVEANPGININPMPLPQSEIKSLERAGSNTGSCVPIVEEPKTPEQEYPRVVEGDIEDIEDMFNEDPEEIPTIKLNMEEFTVTLQNYVQEGDMSKALVAINSEAASLPAPKLKNVSRLRTEHQVYELPDSHPLLQGMDRREPDDPSPYLLAIWRPGETPDSVEVPDCQCQSQEPNKLCNEKTCFSCNSIRETNSNIVRGTILIPCRTAMRGSFPLNGTYFQVNEVFADHESSINPIDVPRAWIWNLPRRIVYFGTSVSTIFKGLSTQGIQYCFWKGFVCVRGFDQKTRAPRPLTLRLHFPASKLVKTKNERK